MFSSKLPTQAGVLENKPEERPGAERKNAPCILACRKGILKSLYSRQCRRNVLPLHRPDQEYTSSRWKAKTKQAKTLPCPAASPVCLRVRHRWRRSSDADQHSASSSSSGTPIAILSRKASGSMEEFMSNTAISRLTAGCFSIWPASRKRLNAEEAPPRTNGQL